MSRRSDRRRRALQRSLQFANERINAAKEKHGFDDDRAPLPSANIAQPLPFSADASEHDPSEIGRAPGELPASSPFESEGPTRFRVICYNETTCTVEEFSDIDRVPAYADRPGVTWIQMMGLTDPEIVHMMGAIFNIPMLAQEDVLAVWSRTKVDEYGDMLLAITRGVRLKFEDVQTSGGEEDSGSCSLIAGSESDSPPEVEPRGQQISIIAAPTFVISFHESNELVFEAIERRLKENTGRIRKLGTGYLFYSLIDTLVDRMLFLTEEIEDAIGEIEDKFLTQHENLNIDEVYHLKRIVVRLGRVAYPMREAMRTLGLLDHELLSGLDDVYLRDLNDHVLRAGDRVEHARVILQDLQDYHHMLQERKTNDIIRVLTVMSSIFIPLTFVVGIYGMNFENMPEIKTQYGYFVCIAVMLAFAIGMLVYFRRKKWI
ncbi:MAG: magnesium and cobalt transport protein CorA [Puniceicoccales bacterium]|jgi:magnesium transporter|nr:magnesium and cobalt transport protein CorA [Puniceicoccales bacterium]